VDVAELDAADDVDDLADVPAEDVGAELVFVVPVLDDGGALEDVPADVDEDDVRLDEEVFGVDASDVCFASTGRVEAEPPDDGAVTEPDVPVPGV
jgi:hypothetical protein